jgi:hypothetical protein
VIRRLSAGLLALVLSAAVLYAAPVVEAKGKPACHPRKGCVTTTTVAPTSTTVGPTTTIAPTTTTTQAPTTTVPPTTTTTSPPPTGALWWGNADIDVDRGDQTDCMGKDARDGGTLTIADDPLGQYGRVYRAHVVGDAPRAEWDRAYRNCDGDTEVNLWGEDGPGTTDVWVGWRSLFTGDYALSGSENDGNVMQWKGDSSCGGPAVGMTIRNGRLSLRTIDGDPPGVEGLWVDPVLFSARHGRWTEFVMRTGFAKDSTGFIELWVDGVPQIMSDGTTRHEGPTVCPNDARVIPKFGVYSMRPGADAVHWIEDPRIGTSAAAVTP